MAINSDKRHLWADDVKKSVALYNSWFMEFAPLTYRETRGKTTELIESAMERTNNFRDISANVLLANPAVLPILRMVTAPPIARDRLIGLSGVTPNLVKSMELNQVIPSRMNKEKVNQELSHLGDLITALADKDICPWLATAEEPTEQQKHTAASIIADRHCGALSDPIVRNAQEQRQLKMISSWLEKKGYRKIEVGERADFRTMAPGTFGFRVNIPVTIDVTSYNIPIDVTIKPKGSAMGEMPILIEAKSAGDFTNTNKRRKEEAAKSAQLKHTYGSSTSLILFLCGYFDEGYLGYEAAEGIDWIWEHRIEDMEKLGL